MFTRILTREVVLVGIVVVATLLLAGCSDSDSSTRVGADESMVSLAI